LDKVVKSIKMLRRFFLCFHRVKNKGLKRESKVQIQFSG
jgi:hypothetical protein